MEDYLAARIITTPLCLFDCDAPCDGSTAVVVSHRDVAGDLDHPAVQINAVGTALRGRPSWAAPLSIQAWLASVPVRPHRAWHIGFAAVRGGSEFPRP